MSESAVPERNRRGHWTAGGAEEVERSFCTIHSSTVVFKVGDGDVEWYLLEIAEVPCKKEIDKFKSICEIHFQVIFHSSTNQLPLVLRHWDGTAVQEGKEKYRK